mgnify:CR=1 FL=1
MTDPLEALKPLHALPPITWWPPAPGWWLLLLLVLLVGVWLYLRRRKMAPRRAALAELKVLESSGRNPASQAGELNRLLKRYALVCCPGVGVESLAGEAWLAFLDEHGGKGNFSGQTGRVLLTLPYGDEMVFPSELFTFVRQWIKANRPAGGAH